MVGSITHATVAVGTDAGNGEIRKAQWNEDHVLDGVPYVMAQSAVAVSVGAVTTETVLATISFAGGEIGPNGWVQVIMTITTSNNANNKVQRVRLGGAAGTLMAEGYTTTAAGNTRVTTFANRNSESSQIGLAPMANNVGIPGSFAAGYPTATVDTSSAWDLVLSGHKPASAGDTYTLEAYQVLVCYGA